MFSQVQISYMRFRTKTSEAGGQRCRGGGPPCLGCDVGRQAGRSCVLHVAHHRRGAGAEVYEVILCGLAQDLVTNKHVNTLFILLVRERERLRPSDPCAANQILFQGG